MALTRRAGAGVLAVAIALVAGGCEDRRGGGGHGRLPGAGGEGGPAVPSVASASPADAVSSGNVVRQAEARALTGSTGAPARPRRYASALAAQVSAVALDRVEAGMGARGEDAVTIKLTVDPPKVAHVFWGVRDLGLAPLEIQRPRGSGPLDLVLRAPGYLVHHTRVFTDRNDRLSIHLAPESDGARYSGYHPPERTGKALPPPSKLIVRRAAPTTVTRTSVTHVGRAPSGTVPSSKPADVTSAPSGAAQAPPALPPADTSPAAEDERRDDPVPEP
jgi:hypothetical protein